MDARKRINQLRGRSNLAKSKKRTNNRGNQVSDLRQLIPNRVAKRGRITDPASVRNRLQLQLNNIGGRVKSERFKDKVDGDMIIGRRISQNVSTNTTSKIPRGISITNGIPKVTVKVSERTSTAGNNRNRNTNRRNANTRRTRDSDETRTAKIMISKSFKSEDSIGRERDIPVYSPFNQANGFSQQQLIPTWPNQHNFYPNIPQLPYSPIFISSPSQHYDSLYDSKMAMDVDESANVMSRLNNTSRNAPIVSSPTTSIIVSNLNKNVSTNDIKELFGDIGTIVSLNMANPTIAVIKYSNHEDAILACQTYHNRLLDGLPMQCNLMPDPDSQPTTTQRRNTRDSSFITTATHSRSPTYSHQMGAQFMSNRGSNRSSNRTSSKDVRFTVKI